MKAYCSFGQTVAIVGCAVGALAAQPTIAQEQQTDTARGVSVTNRPRPDFDALGIRAGSFLVFPKLDVKETYNSNIFATENTAKSDFISLFSPTVTVLSDWNQHALNFSAGASSAVYKSFSTENYNEFSFGTDGRLDIVRDAYLTGALQYKRLHEDRGDPNANGNAASPVLYDLYTARAGVSYGAGRLSARLSGTSNTYRFSDTPAIGGGTIAGSPRDRTENEVGPRVAYELIPGVTPFVETLVNWREYSEQVSKSRNSIGYRVNVGTTLDLGGVVTGNIYTGYIAQNYDGSAFKDIGGLGFGAALLWNPSGLTSVIVSGSRSIEETTSTTASGFIASSISVRVEHELMRSLVAYGSVGYTQNDYEGNNQTDKIPQFNLGGEYYLNRYLTLSPEYSFKDKKSNLAGNSYAVHLISLRLTGKI